MFLQPEASRRLAKGAVLTAVVIGLMYVTPLKGLVLDRLPFIGSDYQDTVSYRETLAQVSWSLIQLNPFFGDPFVYLRMEGLRQGQGIIDIVNGYLYTALFTGLVGLALQTTVLAIALARGTQALFRVRRLDDDLAFLGASLVAVLLATLFFIASAGYSTTVYILAALLVSYARVTATSPSIAAPQRFGAGIDLARPPRARSWS